MKHDPQFAEVAEKALQCAAEIVGEERGCVMLVFRVDADEGVMQVAGASNARPLEQVMALISYLESTRAGVGAAVHAPFLPVHQNGQVH